MFCRSFAIQTRSRLGVRLLSNIKMDKLAVNPYFEKYSEKLKDKQQNEPEQFQAGLSEIEAQHKKKLDELEEAKQEIRERAQQAKNKKLSDVMNLDLICDKTAEEIAELWSKYHKDKTMVYGVIEKEEYDIMSPRFAEFPTFLHAVPRYEGYEIFLQQFDGPHCHFTPMASYQLHRDNSPVCLSMFHFTELKESKGIVLMNGEINTKVISVHEAQCLALSLKMYYGINAALKFNLVRLFKNSPEKFRYEDVIREFEKYKQDFKDREDEGTPV